MSRADCAKNQPEIHSGRFPVGFCCFFIDGEQSSIFLIVFSLTLVIFRTEFLIFGSLWLRFPEVQQKLPPVQRPKQKPGRPTVIPEREVLFSGQAFDADYISNPSKKFVQPVTRPDVFDLTVSVKQNFGGNNPKPKGNFLIVIM